MRILTKINSPKDIKGLNSRERRILAKETREFLINSVSETGGHLASSLGVVELTIALHYCFELPKDKIVWDVGHQAYAHKLYTGRRKDFKNLRRLDGLSGFPKHAESEYDCFDTGHSSTSISAAFGMAVGRDMRGQKYAVAAVIGDGSMTGGLAYEGLNNAGRAKTPMLVILNDNRMSISENVGALSKMLNEFRSAPAYIGAKTDVKGLLKRISPLGVPIGGFLKKTKKSLKSILVPGHFFEEMGFSYFGPVDGHDTDALIDVISKVKNLKKPVLLHVHTVKGKGFVFAEKKPEKFHGVAPFNPYTGELIKRDCKKSYSAVFCDTLVSAAKSDKRIVAVTASMTSGTGLAPFFEAFPDRLFDVGIAEGHAVTFCAGLSRAGMVPVFAVYSSFLQRGYDQLLHDVCAQNLHAVFAVDRAGIVGEDGETHQGLFDLSYLGHMPNMTVIAPKNGDELKKALIFALNEMKSPVTIRYPKGAASDIFEEETKENMISYGKSEIICQGEDIALVAVGCMAETAEYCRAKLAERGFSAALVNAVFVKPIDENMVRWLDKFKYVFTFEDNVLQGGFGSAVRLLTDKKIHCFAFPDEFISQGTREQLFVKYKMDKDSLYGRIIDIMGGDMENGTP